MVIILSVSNAVIQWIGQAVALKLYNVILLLLFGWEYDSFKLLGNQAWKIISAIIITSKGGSQEESLSFGYFTIQDNEREQKADECSEDHRGMRFTTPS
jgi:hypothetical protein